MTSTPARTPRHYAAGARVTHKQYGAGTIYVRPTGEKAVRFDDGAMGTPMTRVWPLDDDEQSAPCALTTADTSPRLEDEIVAVVAAELAGDSTLDATPADARRIMAAIEDADLRDDTAMHAYDLLHQRVTFGRAF